MHEESYDAIPEEPALPSAFGDLQRESARLMKTVEVLTKRLLPVLVPEREEPNRPMAAVDVPITRSELGDTVEQFRDALQILDRLIRRIEL
jgi:hypothetical protein